MEKKIYHIHNVNLSDEHSYVKLTNNTANFLKWLDDNGYLDIDTLFEEVKEIPLIEF